MILLEGNAYGKPCLALARSGPKESQVHDRTGYLLKESTNEFAKKTAKLAGDKRLAVKLGKWARNNVKKHGFDVFVNRIDALLEMVVR